MKIKKIKIKNFRLLNEFSIDLENDLSLVIGKNNTGKTSFLILLERFLNSEKNTFEFHDFNISAHNRIKNDIDNDIDEADFKEVKIQIRIFIEYFKDDSLENISNLILNLSPQKNILVLSFEYCLDLDRFKRLKKDYAEFKKDFKDKTVLDYLKKEHQMYFSIKRTVIDVEDEDNSIEIKADEIKKIINLQTISAKRDVANTSGFDKKSNKNLSSLSYSYFNASRKNEADSIKKLRKNLFDADKNLSKTYKETFKDVIQNIKKFSYNKNVLPENKYAWFSENKNASKMENKDARFYTKNMLIIFIFKNCFPVFHPVTISR